MNPFDNVMHGNIDYFKEVSIEVLLKSRDEKRDSLLSKVVMEQDLNCTKVIYGRCPELLYCESNEGYHALHHAAARDNLEVLKFIINADVECQGRGANKRLTRLMDNYGNVALMIALKNKKSLEAVKLLIDADPSFHPPPNHGNQTPLKFCMADTTMQEMFKLILNLAPNQSKTPMGPDGWTILHYAASTRDLRSIANILRFCPDCSIVEDNTGQNFLHTAARYKEAEVVRFCIEEKKDITLNALNKQDKKGWTSLHHAARRGYLSVIMEIINFCPDCLELVNNEGMTFLHVAVENQQIEVVKRLFRDKKIPNSVLNLKDNNGNTPLHIAALSDNVDLTKCFLYDKNIDKMTVNKYGQHVLEAINFEYDKRKAGVSGVMLHVDQKDLKDQSDFDLVVGALIATVSFTAGITVPGGYISDGRNKGTAVLSRKTAFQVFVISNTFALLFSLYAVFSHYCTRRLVKTHDILYQLKVATNCTLGAICAMMTTFIAGSFAVLADSIGLAISVGVICFTFYILSIRPLWKIIIRPLWKIIMQGMGGFRQERDVAPRGR